MRELKRNGTTIAASVSCFNLYNLESQVPLLEEAGVELLHFDVVDGRFNDCIILGTPTLQALRPHTSLPIEVHLGVYEPEKYIQQFVDAGADYIAVHYEVMKKPLEIFEQIKKAGAKPLLALRAETEADAGIIELLPHIDWIIKLTVNPGYAGQPFKSETVEKIHRLRAAIKQAGFDTGIEADGCINPKTIPAVVQAGADMLTGGTSGLFQRHKTIQESVQEMRNSALIRMCV